MSDQHPVIFFDGYCKLCNAAVQFVIRHDKADKFRFVSLQSHRAGVLLKRSQIDKQEYDSIVYRENGKIYQQSDAVLRICRQLGGGWRIFYVFMLIPRFLRDPIYRFVARNRYRWFGRRNECSLLPPGKVLE
mgnify:CR=1 FL=1